MGSSLPTSEGHFRASITIFPLDRSARTRPAFNGIRWGFVYADEFDQIGLNGNKYEGLYSDVWPEFLDHNGDRLDAAVPLVGSLPAIMHIVLENMIPVHLNRLTVGARFYCVEGTKPCAEGVVTKLSV